MNHSESPSDDPFESHFRREPRRGADVDVLVLDAGRPEHAREIGEGLRSLIAERGRSSTLVLVPSRPGVRLGEGLAEGLASTVNPLVLVTDAVQSWTAAHLDPILEAIDKADHVGGRRPVNPAGGLLRRASWLGRKILYNLPVLDPWTPCRLHRREALTAIPLQSETDYLAVEIAAKATFLGHLIDEVPVPMLLGDEVSRNAALRRHDAAEILRHPVFAKAAPIRPGAWDGPAGRADF